MERRSFCAGLASVLSQLICGVCAARSPQRNGCNLAAVSGGADLPNLLPSSGRKDIDDFCKQEIAHLNSVFQQEPLFSYFEDNTSPNAIALAGTLFPDERPRVFLGRTLAVRTVANRGPAGKERLLAVLAHEYAHLHHYKQKNLITQWGVRFELLADHLAGWHLARNKGLSRSSLASVASMFSALGDNSFTSEDHHGTPQQRARIFLAGANAGTGVGNLFDDDLPTNLEEAYGRAVSMARGGL